jgi:photosystem II stability/assembly factor-like uncharacterized protein
MKVMIAVRSFLLQLALCAVVVYAQGNGFILQVASVPTEEDARAMTAKLEAKGLKSYWTKVEVPGMGTRYRVQVGPFGSRDEARRKAEQARSQGLIKEFIIIANPGAAAAATRDTKGSASKSREGETKTNRASEPKSSLADATAKGSAKSSTKTRVEESSSKTVAAGETTTNVKENAPGAIGKADEPPLVAEKGEKGEKAENIDAASESKGRRANQPESDADKKQPLSSGGEETRAAAITLASLEAAAPADPLTKVTIENPKWEIVRRSNLTDKNLRAIYFVDSLTGWAAGDAGTVYRTTDGGRTWKLLVTNTSVNINRIHFVDWNTGWMLGEAPGKDDGPSQTVLLSTINGGRKWKRQPLPDVVSFYFIDAKTGWAAGRDAKLLKTTDGGATWQNYEGMEKMIGLPVESGTYNYGFCDVQFIDAKTGWAIGNFYGRAKSHLGSLFVTSDGGATWKRMPLTVQTKYSSSRLTPGLLHTVRFSDVSTGVVTGEMQDGEARYFFVLQTKDGGKTWQQHRALSHSAHRTQFVSAAQGWTSAAAPRKDEAGDVTHNTSLMRTENGGALWLTDFTAQGNQIRGLFFLSPTKGWAVGDRGLILRYEDR